MPAASALVWFKRDLRLRDHAALAAARQFDAVAALFVIEPAWLRSPECDARHVDFTLACLRELRAGLARLGLPLLVRVGALPAVLGELRHDFAFSHLLSHEETGPGWSYQRDLEVGAWCRERGVLWQEFTQTGVVRRLRSRNGWAVRWDARMNAQPADLGRGTDGRAEESGFAAAPGLAMADLPTLDSLTRFVGVEAAGRPGGLDGPGTAPHGKTLQAAGEAAAWDTLRSFLAGRGRDYRRGLSSPLSAQQACSRLSPHLAFGTISLRSVHQATEARIRSTDDRALAYGLRGFAGRLRWHCHFMQKLEDEPEIEFRNFSRAADGLREGDFDRARFDAWCAGATGYPMVDACMRSLRATGWLNFRMRAMLVSFASYHLWLHWRETGLFLARQFLDFEAGIHWSQMQMQSGTTGINTLRIYSPTKQALDHDPDGIFIRRWLPELKRVPLPRLAEPWRMSADEQRQAGCVIGHDYPAPVVDDRAALKLAKERVYGLRQTPEAREEAQAIQQRHGSRKSGLPATVQPRRTVARRAPRTAAPAITHPSTQAAQPGLFDEGPA